MIDNSHLCANCIRRPIDCIIKGQFRTELSANFICRATGKPHHDGHHATCHVGHLKKYCPKIDRCRFCIEPGNNCSACALARAMQFVNVAMINTIFKFIPDKKKSSATSPAEPQIAATTHHSSPHVPVLASKAEKKKIHRVAARQISTTRRASTSGLSHSTAEASEPLSPV